jgi:hypothetical protein
MHDGDGDGYGVEAMNAVANGGSRSMIGIPLMSKAKLATPATKRCMGDGVAPTGACTPTNLTFLGTLLGVMRRMDFPGSNRCGSTLGNDVDGGTLTVGGLLLVILLVFMLLKGTYDKSGKAVLFIPNNMFLWIDGPAKASCPPTCI